MFHIHLWKGRWNICSKHFQINFYVLHRTPTEIPCDCIHALMFNIFHPTSTDSNINHKIMKYSFHHSERTTLIHVASIPCWDSDESMELLRLHMNKMFLKHESSIRCHLCSKKILAPWLQSIFRFHYHFPLGFSLQRHSSPHCHYILQTYL